MRKSIIAFSLLAVFTVGIQFLPLFGRLGFEFSAATGFLVMLFSGMVAIFSVKGNNRSINNATPGQFYAVLTARALLVALPCLIIPLIVCLIRSIFVGICQFREGIAFYLLIPGVSYVHGAVLGAFSGVLGKGRFRSYICLCGYLIATLLWAAYLLIFQPQTFVYSASFGFFPGPIYDQKITITGTLIIARIAVLVESGLIFTLGVNLMRRDRTGFDLDAVLKRKGDLGSVVNRIWLAVFCIALLLIFAFGSELGLRSTRRYIRKRLGGEYETEHFRIFYKKGSKAEREIEWIAHDHEFRYHQLSSYLQIESNRKMVSYIYPSASEKKRLMGAEHTSIEDPFGYEIHINYQDFPHDVLKHELAHLFSANLHPLLKFSIRIGLHEGFAVAAAWDERRLTPHQWSKAMSLLGIMPELSKIMGAIGFWTESSSRAYMVAGSFVRYLSDRYGIEKTKRVFPTGNFEKVYGKSLEELGKEWREFLDGVDLRLPDDLDYARTALSTPPIVERKCPHQVARIISRGLSRFRERDYDGAASEFRRAYEIDENNIRTLYYLALSTFHRGDLNEAVLLAETLLSHSACVPYYAMLARELIGDVRWMSGDREGSIVAYRSALSLRADSSLTREMQIKLAAINSSDVDERLIMRALIDDSDLSAKIADIGEVIRRGDRTDLALYLIGRWLTTSGEYERALSYWQELAGTWLINALPSDGFRSESFRLYGLSLFRMNRLERAREMFEKMRSYASCEAERLTATDWMKRCEYRMRKK